MYKRTHISFRPHRTCVPGSSANIIIIWLYIARYRVHESIFPLNCTAAPSADCWLLIQCLRSIIICATTSFVSGSPPLIVTDSNSIATRPLRPLFTFCVSTTDRAVALQCNHNTVSILTRPPSFRKQSRPKTCI